MLYLLLHGFDFGLQGGSLALVSCHLLCIPRQLSLLLLQGLMGSLPLVLTCIIGALKKRKEENGLFVSHPHLQVGVL